jgi:hypothetical protein
MNAFTFTQELAKKYNGKVNIIHDCGDCFSAENIDGKSTTMDVVRGKRIDFKTIKQLKEKSRAFVKSFPTVLVQLKGTDYAKAITTEIN